MADTQELRAKGGKTTNNAKMCNLSRGNVPRIKIIDYICVRLKYINNIKTLCYGTAKTKKPMQNLKLQEVLVL